MIVIIDNYDSFVYNLQLYLRRLGFSSKVFRNDQVSIEELKALPITHILLSPGPARPEQAGICLKIIQHFQATVPILGVCLGHQALGFCAGARIVHAKHARHGKDVAIYHLGQGLFQGLENPLMGACYHSLAVEKDRLSDYIVDAWTDEGEIMSIRHQKFASYGLQFHPESILTPLGINLIKNFLFRS